MAGLIVDGYCFETTEAYHDARKEFESITYLRAKTDFRDMKSLVKLYNSLLDKNSFHTPVGIGFLKELYDKIITEGAISKSNLPPVPVRLVINKQGQAKGFEQDMETRLKLRLSYSEKRRKNSLAVNVILVIVICILFAITLFGDRSPFIDAELQFQNKYASWEEDLTKREQAVLEKEKELGIWSD